MARTAPPPSSRRGCGAGVAVLLGLAVWTLAVPCPGAPGSELPPVPQTPASGQSGGPEPWPQYAGPATQMLPVPYPPGWTPVPLSQGRVDLVRITAPDGTAALELLAGLAEGQVSALQVARSAIDNLSGGAPGFEVREQGRWVRTGGLAKGHPECFVAGPPVKPLPISTSSL